MSKRRQPGRSRSPKQKKRFGVALRWMVMVALLGVVGGLVWELLKPQPFERVPALQGPVIQIRQQLHEHIASNVTPPFADTPISTPAPTPERPAPIQSPEPDAAAPLPQPPRTGGRQASTTLEAQVALMRQAISPGVVDGVIGSQTRAALRAFQQRERIPATGALDTATRARLRIDEPLIVTYTVTATDLARLEPLRHTWLGKSQQRALEFETVLELVSEQSRSSPSLVRSLNQTVDWARIGAGTRLRLPDTSRLPADRPAAFVLIRLSDRTLQAHDSRTNLLAQFPCSIGRLASKRPTGRLHVEVRIPNPNYTFNPAIFPESAEGRELGRKLVIPPGPNNPVGTVWIGLDRPGYGIHGTPIPENVGRTESHGCFRLANWDAEYLLQLVWKGMPVWVEE